MAWRLRTGSSLSRRSRTPGSRVVRSISRSLVWIFCGAQLASGGGAGLAEAAQPASAKARATPAKRELRRRPLRITDDSAASVTEIHVAAGTPSTLSFQVALKDNGVLL